MSDRSPAIAENGTIEGMDRSLAPEVPGYRFLGEQDINAIVRGEIAISPGDTFTLESIDRKGVSAYAYEPGCRQGQGEWNDFRCLYSGLRTTAIATAISFANNP